MDRVLGPRAEPGAVRLAKRSGGNGERQRAATTRQNRVTGGGVARLLRFKNPYPWMSEPEAMVHLELEARGVPFSWRYFDAFDQAPTLLQLMPDFSPEFTLREYRIVILVIGGFWGTLPTILDKNLLGKVLLEEDGWTVLMLNEWEIRGNVKKLLDQAPALAGATIKGPIRVNPYGTPNFMAQRRANLKGQSLRSAKFDTQGPGAPKKGGDSDTGRARLKRRAAGSGGSRPQPPSTDGAPHRQR